MVTKDEVTPKQKLAIAALILGKTYKDAAAAAGVHQNRITAWMKKPVFLEALHKAENDALQGVSRSLIALADKAAGQLETVLDNKKARDSAKLRAADIVLARLLHLRELIELEERIKRLEDLLGNTEDQ